MATLEQLVKYFVDRVPNAGRTQLVKFLYLADIESRQYLGRPISDLTYEWFHHGPFDERILASLDTLCSDELVTEERVQFPNGIFGYRYQAVSGPIDLDVSPAQASILDHVVDAYGRQDLRSLLEDVVYQTRPMVDAKQREAFGEPLNMQMVDNKHRLSGLELERLWESWLEAENGQTRPLVEVMDELQAADHAPGQ